MQFQLTFTICTCSPESRSSYTGIWEIERMPVEQRRQFPTLRLFGSYRDFNFLILGLYAFFLNFRIGFYYS